MLRRICVLSVVLLPCLLSAADPKPLFDSKVVSKATPDHAVNVDVDLQGAKELYLVVADGGDGFSADWVVWAEPRLVRPDDEIKLTELKWKSAEGLDEANRRCE